MGFNRGYSVGQEAGWRDGYLFGFHKSAQLSAEIGYYQGFAHAWLSVLEHKDSNKQRKINALHSLLEMTRSFPGTSNLLIEFDTMQKLARIRAKFKQVNALILGTGSHGSYFTSSFENTAAAGAGSGAGSTGAASNVPGAGSAGAASNVSAASGTAAGQHHHHPHSGVYHRGASCTSQESGVGSTSFRGVSPGSTGGTSSCPHHHRYHHHATQPPNVEMSF